MIPISTLADVYICRVTCFAVPDPVAVPVPPHPLSTSVPSPCVHIWRCRSWESVDLRYLPPKLLCKLPCSLAGRDLWIWLGLEPLCSTWAPLQSACKVAKVCKFAPPLAAAKLAGWRAGKWIQFYEYVNSFWQKELSLHQVGRWPQKSKIKIFRHT